VAFEVGLGAAFGASSALVTMKHVGVNVAADPLFTAAYSGVPGALVLVSADDPGMASSQNEQDNRRYAVAAGVPMLEPADSQEAYDFTVAAFEISARWHLPVMLRMTTRVCHSKTLVDVHPVKTLDLKPHFERDISGRVMVPMHARAAHRRLRQKLAEIAAWGERSSLNSVVQGDGGVGVITSGVTFMHVREAAPETSILKLGLTYPLPMEQIRQFVECVDSCVVIEENDPYLYEQIQAAGIDVEQKPEMYRFGELNVDRVRRILSDDVSPEPAPLPGKPPQLCMGCPHRATFEALKKLDCIVAGDIGCYTLGAMAPLSAMDSQLCMGASIGMGLGMRHVLPEAEARRVVSVIGDSTFVHSGITGLVEMVYNPPPTGHVVLILDNGTTAMTGLQEHPGTGRTLGLESTGRFVLEDVACSLGLDNVTTLDPVADPQRFEAVLRDALAKSELSVIVVRRRCILAAAKDAKQKKVAEENAQCETPVAQPEAAPAHAPVLAGPTSNEKRSLCNIIVAGLGGQGVLTASDILGDALLLMGYDVKKAEVHGMSQRGGSVATDVRFGDKVLSPMVPPGEADFLVVMADDQVENNRPRLREGGVLIRPDAVPVSELSNRRSVNIALLGVLSRYLEIPETFWFDAIRKNVKPELYDVNRDAFQLGRSRGAK
jgi:indolepyruvate ferredoxin oxidoreductase alpha subunit